MSEETRKDIKALDAAIDAIKKIERIIVYCKDRMLVQFETEYSEGYVNGFNMATREILKILEDAQHDM